MLKVFFWLLVVLSIALRFFLTKPHFSDGQRVRITSKVLTEPIRFENSQYLKIAGLKVYLPLYPEVSYQDKVVVEGTVEGDKLIKPKLVLLKKTNGRLFQMRSGIIAFYKRVLPEPSASLLAGVVLGSKSGMPEDFWEKIKKTGTAHVVVASGMNVSLIGGFVLSVLLNFISRRRAVAVTIIFIWLYAVVAGLEAPIIRAAIMGSILFVSQLAGRLSVSMKSLFISAVVMLLVKPLWITDLGFWLSFTATFSLMLFQKRVEKHLGLFPKVFREGLSTSLAAQIGVAPILYFSFGNFNLLSPIINALILWTIAPITVIGMTAGLLGIIIPSLGSVILYLTYPLTSWFIFIISL